MNKSHLFFTLLIITTGCAQSVSPWERGYLAKENMQLVTNPLENTLINHTLSSKEAASGGYGIGGGGCGCN